MAKPPHPGDNRGLILMYHRVAEVDSDPWGLCVSPRHFSEQLEVLTEYGTSLGLSRFIHALNRGRLPPRPIVVTFDDGYMDNLSDAAPLLERYEVPATIFLVSGAMGRRREFWWDELERVLLQPGPLPKDLQLMIAGNFQSLESKRSHRLEQAVNSLPPTRFAKAIAIELDPCKTHPLSPSS